jgi:hypothetical protein
MMTLGCLRVCAPLCSVEDWLGNELGHLNPGEEEHAVPKPGWSNRDDRPAFEDRIGLSMLHAFAFYYTN